MGTGIIICGMNGAGKSTLGRALAEHLDFHFIDNEDLFFTRTSDDAPYVDPRSRQEVEALLMDEVSVHPDFVFAAVKGDYGRNILPFYSYAILVTAPKALRMQRIRERSYRKFGDRMLPGGDLHEEEQQFFNLAASRPDNLSEKWVQTLSCPVIMVDGTLPVSENIAIIRKQTGIK